MEELTEQQREAYAGMDIVLPSELLARWAKRYPRMAEQASNVQLIDYDTGQWLLRAKLHDRPVYIVNDTFFSNLDNAHAAYQRCAKEAEHAIHLADKAVATAETAYMEQAMRDPHLAAWRNLPPVLQVSLACTELTRAYAIAETVNAVVLKQAVNILLRRYA